MKLLVESGEADVEIKNGVGKTAFDEAENAGYEEMGAWLGGKMKGEERIRSEVVEEIEGGGVGERVGELVGDEGERDLEKDMQSCRGL